MHEENRSRTLALKNSGCIRSDTPDADWFNRPVYVRRQFHEKAKTARDRRVVPLDPSLL